MKKGLLLGALAATALWSGAALAGDEPTKTEVNTTQQTTQAQPTDSWRDSSVPDQNTGVGGSGDLNTASTPQATPAIPQETPKQGSVTVDPGNGQKVVVEPKPGQDVTVQTGQGGAGLTPDQPVAQPAEPAPPAYLPTQPEPVVKEESSSSKHMRGVSVVGNAGVEGYTGSLAPRIDPGLTYGAALGLRPSKVFGVELGYSGAVNEVDTGSSNINAATGADIVRNGGSAVATLGLTASPVQPYILAGVGVNDYRVRGATALLGFKNDVSGDVPVGAGVRTQVGAFTADARFGYHIPFDDQFAAGTAARSFVGLNSENAGRYQATVNLGSTF